MLFRSIQYYSRICKEFNKYSNKNVIVKKVENKHYDDEDSDIDDMIKNNNDRIPKKNI